MPMRGSGFRSHPWVVGIALSLMCSVACQGEGLSGLFGSSSRAPANAVTTAAVQAPPGSREESLPGNYVQLLAEAQLQEQKNATIKALQLYRQALESAPKDLPEADRTALVQTIARLSFVLGVDAGSDDGKSRGEAHESASPAVAQARQLYTQAQEKEKAGDTAAALALYTQIRNVITEKDDATLYWNAWQRAADLQPESSSAPALRAGPSVGPRPATASKEGEDSEEEDGEVPNDGSVVNGGPARSSGEGRGQDPQLTKARALYVKAMSASRTGDTGTARSALSEIVNSISAEQDPELYRAASQKLSDLQP